MQGRLPSAYQRPRDYEFAFTSGQALALLAGLVLAAVLMFVLGVSVGARMSWSAEETAPIALSDPLPKRETEPLVLQPVAEADAAPAAGPPRAGRSVGGSTTGAAAEDAAGGHPAPDAGETFAERLLAGGRLSIANAPEYDASYHPGGDPGPARGTAVDLVIRAFRHAGVDLQQRVHEDIVRSPESYGISEPDRSIDHRRLRNLVEFLSRRARSLPTGSGSDWRPGDLVVWRIDEGGRSWTHIGILSDRVDAYGDPLVIHHKRPGGGFSGAPSEDDVLFRWPVLHHYRWPPPA